MDIRVVMLFSQLLLVTFDVFMMTMAVLYLCCQVIVVGLTASGIVKDLQVCLNDSRDGLK